jgi:hypothetical protein
LELRTVVVDPVFYQPFCSFLTTRFPSRPASTLVYHLYFHPLILSDNLIQVKRIIKTTQINTWCGLNPIRHLQQCNRELAGEHIATLQPCHIHDTPLLGIPSSTQTQYLSARG